MAFRPQQLTVVWNLLLQTDSEGPPFIFDTASCSYEHVLDTTPHRSVRAELPHTALPLEIDSAFQRRMDLVIDFRPPEAVERWNIWQMHLPAGHAVDESLLTDGRVGGG